MVTALPGKVLVILPSRMLTALLCKVLVILPSRMVSALPGRSSIILYVSIAVTLHNSTDNPDIFVQKASIDSPAWQGVGGPAWQGVTGPA